MFESSALKSFGFLVDNLGYSVTDRSPSVVTFRCNEFVVSVQHDSRRSYELTVAFGKEGQTSPFFDLGEMLRSCRAPENLPSSYQVVEERAIPEFIEKLASNLRSHCIELLQGSAAAFERLVQLRERESEEFGRKRDLQYAREDASLAWADRNYAQVILALKPHESWLNKSEKKKLEIAQRELSKRTKGEGQT